MSLISARKAGLRSPLALPSLMALGRSVSGWEVGLCLCNLGAHTPCIGSGGPSTASVGEALARPLALVHALQEPFESLAERLRRCCWTAICRMQAGHQPRLLQSQLALTQPRCAFCNSHVESHTL